MKLLMLLLASVSCLTDLVKDNVRKNFGTDRFIAISSAEVTDLVTEILNGKSHDQFGYHEGHHHIKVSAEIAQSLLAENIEFFDHTEEFIESVERNLQLKEFVCEDLPENCAARPSEEYFNSYHTLQSLYKRFESLAEDNLQITRLETLGKTYENREQKVFWISDDGEKPLVWYYCGIHAREWISPMYCMHLAETLLDISNEKAQNLLKKFTFVITPIANPDGYGNNFWRKTRKPNNGSDCIGTDPNRNYGYKWGGHGASDEPCTNIYHGAEPFDQECTMNIKTFSDTHKDRLIHIDDVHAYGEYYLSAWAYTSELPPSVDYAKMRAANNALYEAIREFSGLEFKVGPTATTIYPAAGGSMDYFYGVNGILYSGTYEARGGGLTGLNGFQPPVENIKLSNAELFEGTYAFLRKVLDLEICVDMQETNVYFDNRTKPASCAELVDNCANRNIFNRCPQTCNTCFEFEQDYETNRILIIVDGSIEEFEPAAGDDDETNNEQPNDDLYTDEGNLLAVVALVSVSALILASIFSGIYCAVYFKKNRRILIENDSFGV